MLGGAVEGIGEGRKGVACGGILDEDGGAAPRTASFRFTPSPSQQNRLLLEANAAPGTRQIHWFADRRYLGASPPAEPLAWQPIVGDYDLQAMDDAGRVSSTRINPLSPALRSGPTAGSGATRQKQIPAA